jgi:transposase
MKEFTAEAARIETASALAAVQEACKPGRWAAFVGLDVHKETIALAVAEPGREEPMYRGEIATRARGWGS